MKKPPPIELTPEQATYVQHRFQVLIAWQFRKLSRTLRALAGELNSVT